MTKLQSLAAPVARLDRDEHGGVSVLTAVSVGVLIMVSAFTIDMSYGYVTRSKLQATADSSALAGLIELGTDTNTTLSDADKTEIITAAQTYSGLNMASGAH